MKRQLNRTFCSACAATLLSISTALGFYDPGVQRWINRDPLGEPGFEITKSLAPLAKRAQGRVHTGGGAPGSLADAALTAGDGARSSRLTGGPNLYLFARNGPIARVDARGLTTYITKKRKCDDADDFEMPACRDKCIETGVKDCTVIELYILVPGVEPPDDEEYIGKQINCICNPKPPDPIRRFLKECFDEFKKHPEWILLD